MFRRIGGWRLMRLMVIVPLLIALLIPALPMLTKDAKAAGFSVKSGYYVGTGSALSISGLGFQPQLVIIKSNSSTVAQIKTKDMASNTVALASASADSTGVTIDSGGFSLGTGSNYNAINVMFYYEAFAGSDCTASGTFCVGTYSGTGASSRAISTGFQPGLVVAKSNKAVASHFKTTSMPAGRSEFFTSTAADVSGAYVDTLDATGFTVGATDNLSASNFYYMAFKSDASTMAQGTFSGDGLDNRDITGLGLTPNLVLVKNSNSATTNSRRALFTTPESYGDYANYFADGVASTNNFIQNMSSGSFQVGSGVNTNESGSTMYWFALGGSQAANAGSGTYTMQTGSYTGTGSARSISGLGFAPDLVIIKDVTTDQSVFRIKLMPGGSTSTMSSALSDITGGITSLDSDGFSVGTDATTNTLSGTYYWQAFGNAWNPYTNTGASDFAIGVYIGNAVDNRDINGLPFAPSLLSIKRNGGTTGTFRTSSQIGDVASKYHNVADVADVIQGFGANSFQVGATNDSNGLNGTYRWFAFKAGSNFSVGTYSGNGINDRAIASPGFQPSLVWIKNSTTNYAVMRNADLVGDTTQYFNNFANSGSKIKSLTPTGFTLGTAAEVNSNAVVYKYIAWKIPVVGSLGVNVVDADGGSVASPSFTMGAAGFQFECSSSFGSLGTSTQRVRVTNTTSSPAWSLSIAATSGTTSLWQNGGSTQNYDFNDTTTSGCTDGADADSRAGRMTIDASAGTLSAEPGCSNTNVSKGTSSSFDQGVTDSITLLNASSSAQTGCYWDVVGAGMVQTLPAQQPSDSYTINLTVTITAS